MSCQTCYSTISSSSSSKAQTYLTPCCGSPICDACLRRNPRLREYDPCLRCGDIRTASGEKRIKEGKDRVKRALEEEGSGQFTIGDDDDDDYDDIDFQDQNDPPPGYTETQEPLSTAGSSVDQSNISGKFEEEEMEIVEVKHPVMGSDTLFSIARKYAADPYDILSLNNLPPTALTSNPRIIQTRKTLIISRRKVKSGSIPSSLLFDAGEEVDQEEARRRDTEKRLKRFQIITKTTDQGVGKAYLSLAEMDEDKHPLELGIGERIDGKKLHSTGIRGREERALDAFWEDDAWEGQVGRPERVKVNGRWTVVGGVGGSSIKL